MNVSGTVVTISDSKAKFVVAHFRNVAIIRVSDRGVNGVPDFGVDLFSVIISDDGISRNNSRLGSVGGSSNFSTKMVFKHDSLGGNGENGVGRSFLGKFGMGFGLGLSVGFGMMFDSS